MYEHSLPGKAGKIGGTLNEPQASALREAPPSLRPCQHQVAGHLFEDGKAGSLIDDRGHFYKPLQRGPRGDRERAFYDTVAASIRAEQQAAAQAAAVPLQALLPHSLPVAVPVGGSHSAAASAAAADDKAVAALPWHQRRLRQLFPSFRGSLKERGPMAIMQRDELGLLSGRVLAKLGLLGGNSSQPPKPAREQQRRQQHAQQCTVQEAGEEGEESFGEPSSSLSWQGEEVVEVDLQHHDLRLGRSPDSDDLASTGSQLMEAFHEGPCANGGTCPRDGVRLQATAQQYSSSEKHEGCSSSGQQCGMAHLAGDEQQEAQAGIPEGSAGPHHHQQQQQQQQQEQGNTPTVHEPVSQQAVDAYSLPEHAQVAALLGQPTSGCLSVGSNSKPFRSPFVSELLHHSHPPGPLEAQQKQAGNLAAASGMLVADALALQRVARAPSASNETFWLRDDGHGGAGGNGSGSYSAISRLPFSIRNAPLLRMIPKYYGVAAHDEQRTLLELEDLARAYRHPCIIDIKVGFRTWYPHAEERYIQRCRGKDASTTQAALGFKICGMQVFRHGAGGYWRASKRWCKTLPVELVDKALLSFAHNDHGLRPADVYGGAAGAIAQLEALEAWFSVQQDFHFYSSSVLLLYEGDANCEEEAKVGVRMVDFAHTFQTEGRGRDTNFLAGLRALLARLRAVVHSTVAQDLAAV